MAIAILSLLGLGVALPGFVAAATVQQLTALAQQSYLMTCLPTTTEVTCQRGVTRTSPFNIQARIEPGEGEETYLRTRAVFGGTPPATGLDALTRQWMIDMHSLACGDPKGVADYVDAVGNYTKNSTAPLQLIGECDFTGSFTAGDIAAISTWTVESFWRLPPPPSPTPVVTPGPTPIPPTPQATASATPKPSVKPASTATPAPTPPASPSAAPSASAAPSESPSAAPSVAPAPTTTTAPTPETTTATGGEATAEPSAGPTEPPAVGPTPQPSFPTWVASVAAITDVSPDTGAIGGSLLLALLLLLLIGFAGELFNNTVEQNYSEISAWFSKGPLGRLRRLASRAGSGGWLGLLVFLALTALISSFIDPQFGLDLRSIAIFLGFLVGLTVVLASFKLPPMLAHRRRTGDLGRLRPLPWALVIAGLFVFVSRLGAFQPGYLYGIVLGVIFVKDMSDKEEGRQTFYGSLWTLAAAVLSWLGLDWLRGQGLPQDSFGVTLLETAFAATLVAGLEAAAFGLMPLRFMPGHAVYQWNRLAWAVLFGLSVFAFIHLLIGPSSGYVAELSPNAFVAALGVFAAFGTLSIGTWLFFRVRSRPELA